MVGGCAAHPPWTEGLAVPDGEPISDQVIQYPGSHLQCLQVWPPVPSEPDSVTIVLLFASPDEQDVVVRHYISALEPYGKVGVHRSTSPYYPDDVVLSVRGKDRYVIVTRGAKWDHDPSQDFTRDANAKNEETKIQWFIYKRKKNM